MAKLSVSNRSEEGEIRIWVATGNSDIRTAIKRAVCRQTDFVRMPPTESIRHFLEANDPATRGLLVVEPEEFVAAHQQVPAIKTWPEILYPLCMGDNPPATLVRKCFQLGARGFLIGEEPPDLVRYYLRSCLSGGIPVNPQIVPHLLPLPRTAAAKFGLTGREYEILQWLIQGLADKEIAQRADITIHTVKKHLKNSYRKLNVHSRTEAAQRLHEPEE